MKFDEIIVSIGEFGKYQKIRYFLLCSQSVLMAYVVLGGVFISHLPRYRCAAAAAPGLGNDTYEIQNREHALLVNNSVPWVQNGDDEWILSEDEIYLINGSTKFDKVTGVPENVSKVECDVWVYDRSVMEASSLTEFNVFGRKNNHKRLILPTSIMVGFFIGATVSGLTSDAYGRKITCYILFVSRLVCGLASAWAPNFYTFVFFRFADGATVGGLFLCSFVLGMEIVGPSKRVFAGMVIEITFAIGAMSLPGITYAMRAYSWRYLQTLLSLPAVFFLSYWWFLPESPRWLLVKKRTVEAEKMLRIIANTNGTTLPKEFLDLDIIDENSSFSFREYVSSKTLVIRTLILYFNWMVVSFTYYGISLNAGNLGGNIYINMFASGTVEMAAYIFCLLTLDRWGRKLPHVMSMLLGGATLVCTIFIVLYAKDMNWLLVTFAMVGKFGAAAGFAIIHVFSAELYPTVMRNFNMGISSTLSRIGSAMAPVIANIGILIGGTFGKLLPLVTFGVLSIVAGLATLKLPETKGRQLPETIEDGRRFGRRKYMSDVDSIAMKPLNQQ